MSEVKPVIQMWPITDITPYELNAKKHDAEQVSRIVESIRRFGWDQPIVVDKNGVIIKGHGRRLAALELGMKKVPVWLRADLTPEQARNARLADNRAAISDIDPEVLRLELSSLDIDLEGIFDSKELDFMDADLGTINEGAFATNMDEVLEDQRKDIEDRTEKLTGADVRVTVSKAFGFSSIPATGQYAITNLMAKAEAATGLKNEEALVAFAGSLK